MPQPQTKNSEKNHRRAAETKSPPYTKPIASGPTIRGQTNPFPYKSVLNLSKLDSSVTLLWHWGTEKKINTNQSIAVNAFLTFFTEVPVPNIDSR